MSPQCLRFDKITFQAKNWLINSLKLSHILFITMLISEKLNECQKHCMILNQSVNGMINNNQFQGILKPVFCFKLYEGCHNP